MKKHKDMTYAPSLCKITVLHRLHSKYVCTKYYLSSHSGSTRKLTILLQLLTILLDFIESLDSGEMLFWKPMATQRHSIDAAVFNLEANGYTKTLD